MTDANLQELQEQLNRIEASLNALIDQEIREWYSVEEAASLLSRKPFTVREWARNNRINAEKLPNNEWRISKQEITRIKEHGLLRAPRGFN